MHKLRSLRRSFLHFHNNELYTIFETFGSSSENRFRGMKGHSERFWRCTHRTKIYRARNALQNRESGRMFSRMFLNWRSRKCHFLRFPQDILSRQVQEKCSRGQGRVHFFVFHPTKTLLAILLWNKKRIKEIFKQRHPHNTKKL